MNEQSVGQQYSGKVIEVWWNDDARNFLARIEYEDGDAEDVSICELERLHRNTTLTQSVPSSKPLVLRCEKTAVVGLALELSRVKVIEVCRRQEPSDSINVGFEESEKLSFGVVNREVYVGRKIPLASDVFSFPCLSKVVKKRVGPPPGFEKVTSTQAGLCSERNIGDRPGRTKQVHLTLRDWTTPRIDLIAPTNNASQPLIGKRHIFKQQRVCTVALGQKCELSFSTLFLFFQLHFCIQEWLFVGWDPPWSSLVGIEICGEDTSL